MMLELNTAILVAAIQVTCFSLLAVSIYLVARKVGPRVGAMTALSALLLLAAISVMSASPWPRWELPTPPSETTSTQPSLDDSPFAQSEETMLPVVETATVSHEVEQRSEVLDASTPVNEIFWQALRHHTGQVGERLTPDRPAPPHWMGLFFFSGLVLGLAWRAYGLWSLRRQLVRARLVEDGKMLETLDVLQATMSVSGRVELRESKELSTAAAVGWRVPCIVLPSSWRQWNSEQRHVVLAHELAHISRRDYLAWLVAQLGLLLNFYHPIVHWLARRLRLEQELAADALAAQAIGSRETYLKTLGNLALQTPSDSMAWPVQAFLPVRSMFLRRIEVLRHPTSRPYASRLASVTAPVSLAFLVAVAILVSGLRTTPQRQLHAADAGAKSVTPLDASLVPLNTDLLLHFQPAGLLASEEMRPVVSQLDEMMVEATSIRLSNIESIWQLQSFDSDEFLTIIRTKSPHGLYTKHGQTVVPEDGNRGALLPWDNSTVVLGGLGGPLQGFVDRVRSQHTAPHWWKRWSKLPPRTIRAFMDLESMTNKMPPGAKQDPSMAMFAPLLNESKDLLFTIDLDRKTRLGARLRTTNSDSAERVKRTVEALVNLGRNLVDQQASSVGALSDAQMRNALSASLELADRMLASTDVRVKGSNVDIRASGKFGNEAAVALSAALPAVRAAREAARRTQSTNNVKQIVLALLNYEAANGHFPPAQLRKEGSKYPYSWRVAILPYLEQKALYDAYRFDEPWDSPANLKLVSQIPPTLEAPQDNRKKGYTSYFTPLSKHSILGANPHGTRLREISDGTSKTLIVVEAKRDIPWTKPEDISTDVHPRELGGWSSETFIGGHADGSVRSIGHDVDPSELAKMFNMRDGQPLRRNSR